MKFKYKLNRNKEMLAHLKCYLNKTIVLGICCFHISYTTNKIKNTKQLDYYRERGMQVLNCNIENLEYIIGYSVECKNYVRIHLIVGIRPIITPEISGDIIFANLKEWFMYYDNNTIHWVKDIKQVKNDFLISAVDMDFTTFKIKHYNEKLFQLIAPLVDFIAGNFDENFFEQEHDKYSDLGGNFNKVFDNYSFINLIKIYLHFNNMVFKNNKIFTIGTENLAYDNIKELLFVDQEKILKFFFEEFYSQTNIIDFQGLLLRSAYFLTREIN